MVAKKKSRNKTNANRKLAKKKNKLSFTEKTKAEFMCCPKCCKFLSGPNSVRIKPRQKLSKHMQKLLSKRRESEKNLTSRQRQLLQRAMLDSNVLVLKCEPCQWKGHIQLESRKEICKQKAKLKQMVQQESNMAVAEEWKKESKKVKKKERRKRAADAKALELQSFKRLKSCETTAESPVSTLTSTLGQNTPISTSPVPQKIFQPTTSTPKSFSSSSKPVGTPRKATWELDRVKRSDALSGVQRGQVQKKGKQQLQRALNQQKKKQLNVGDSLSNFLNSLK